MPDCAMQSREILGSLGLLEVTYLPMSTKPRRFPLRCIGFIRVLPYFDSDCNRWTRKSDIILPRGSRVDFETARHGNKVMESDQLLQKLVTVIEYVGREHERRAEKEGNIGKPAVPIP
jgi:hypothetical protein